MGFKQLYIIKVVPVNREQKRAAQKEYDEINRTILPFLFAYETDIYENQLKADDLFRKECAKVNRNKKYVEVNHEAFMLNTDSKENQALFKGRRHQIREWAYGIIAFVVVVVALCILF